MTNSITTYMETETEMIVTSNLIMWPGVCQDWFVYRIVDSNTTTKTIYHFLRQHEQIYRIRYHSLRDVFQPSNEYGAQYSAAKSGQKEGGGEWCIYAPGRNPQCLSAFLPITKWQ